MSNENTTASLFGRGEVPQQSNSTVEVFEKVSEGIFSDDNLKLKTELNPREIVAFARGTVFAKKYKRPLLKGLIKELCAFKISHNRKSRKEYESIAKASLGAYNNDEARSIPDRLMGRR